MSEKKMRAAGFTAISRRRMMAGAATLAALGAHEAHATVRPDDSRELFKPCTGLWLAPSNHSAKLYGATNPSASWNVAQWDIPSDLPAFRNNVTENEFASVKFLGTNHYELAQFPRNMECTRRFASQRVLVNEFDLFVSPNGRTTRGYPDAATGTYPSLASATRLRHKLKIEPIELRVSDSTCAVTQGAFITAIALANDSRKQTLFYQLRLAVLRYQKGEMRRLSASPNWFFSGTNHQSGGHGQYGFSDHLASFGQRDCEVGTASAYDIDLLPRLRQVIRAGADKGMDQDLAHWVPRGTYHGSLAFGHIRIRSRWSGFSLAINRDA
jgi:hypothetical protein